MAKISDFIVGFIIVMATAVVLISFVTDLTLNYGLTNAQLMNTTGVSCPAGATITAIRNINALFQNSTVDAGTYAPGQINAPVGANLASSTQASGLVVALKTITAPLTLTKSMITDLGCSLGVPAPLITALEVIFAITVLLLIAGIFYYRPW